ncbi:hypothetical protein D9756_010437 [Leucocoprinus leucothites]|uniref:Uncharacterized protein n=1 Tax=Leucocoprinus leucothites TaxID=201217 RepID=A0A8H5FRS6_9AGAR|nr:hypothetical protein D9756_010437 [Leucoagaricus leucothites]
MHPPFLVSTAPCHHLESISTWPDSRSSDSLIIFSEPVEELNGCYIPINTDDLISVQGGIQTLGLAPSDLCLFQEAHKAVVRSRDRRATLASRIRRIPTEILIHIFIRYLDATEKSPLGISPMSVISDEILLFVRHNYGRESFSYIYSTEEGLQMFWFLSSPDILLDRGIRLSNFYWEGSWDPASLEEEELFEDSLYGHSGVVIDLLIQYAERWGRVSLISGRLTPEFEVQLAQLRSRLPRLFHLELGVSSFQVMYGEAFQSVPLLTELKLYLSIDATSSGLMHDLTQ